MEMPSMDPYRVDNNQHSPSQIEAALANKSPSIALSEASAKKQKDLSRMSNLATGFASKRVVTLDFLTSRREFLPGDAANVIRFFQKIREEERLHRLAKKKNVPLNDLYGNIHPRNQGTVL